MAKSKRRPATKNAKRIASSTHRKTYSYTVLIHPNQPDEKPGFWAEVPALPGCFTRGQTVEQCMERAQEAIEGYIESLVKVDQPIPEEPAREDAVISTVHVHLLVPA